MDLMRTESGPDRHVRIRACVDRLLQGMAPMNGATASAFLSAKAARGAKKGPLKNLATSRPTSRTTFARARLISYTSVLT